jgi:transcriptional regulator with XRE-family HTH domain
VKPLLAGQIRAARALLRWRAEDLAQKSGVGVATIRRAELAEDETSLTAVNDAAIRRTLEEGGVTFIEENGGGPGVRLLKFSRRRKKV